MIRLITFMFFLLSYNFCHAQINKSDKKDSGKNQKTVVQQDTVQQKKIVYISYEVGDDSMTTNINYIPRPDQAKPTDKMIAEAIRIVSQMKTSPQKDESGQNRKMVSRIAFTPNKEN